MFARHTMLMVLVTLLAHAVSALGPSAPPHDQPQQACVRLTVTTTTATWSEEQGWTIDDGGQGLSWSGNSDSDHASFTQEICLEIGNHTITLTDSWRDGWANGSHVKIDRVENGPGPILPMATLVTTHVPNSGLKRTETFYVSAPHPLPPPLPPSPPPLPPSPPMLPPARTFFGLSLEMTVSYSTYP